MSGTSARPRMSRLLLSLAILSSLCVAVTARAQSCAPAEISVSKTEACPYETLTATLQAPGDGSTWQGASWTITGGMFRLPDYPYTSSTASGTNVEFYADGSGTVMVSVTAYGPGCSSTNSAYVALRAIDAPVITTSGDEACPNAQMTATAEPPVDGGEWQAYQWSIDGGGFSLDEYPWTSTTAYTPEVTFYASGPGPATLRLVTYDGSGCVTPQATKEVTIRTVEPPVITVSTPDVCLYESSSASASPPAEGGEWDYYFWTIEGGQFWDPYSGGGTTAYTQTVQFSPDQSGPVTLRLRVWDSQGCEAETSQVLPARVSPAEIVLDSETCPTSATIVNAGNFSLVYWQWGGVEINGSTYEPTVNFTPSGQGPIYLKAMVRYDTGCEIQRELTHQVPGLASTNITLSSGICQGRPATASVPDAGPGATYFWDANGTGWISGPANERTVTVIPSSSDSLALTVRVTNASGCPASSTIHAASSPTPWYPGFESVPSTMCANTTATASTKAEPGSWSYIWEVIGGQILTGQNTRTITFRAGAASPVTVKVTKRYWQGCATTYQHQVAVPQPIAPPSVSASGPTTFCTGGSVTLTAPAGYTYQWSTGATTQSITATAAGNYSVTVRDLAGCNTATSAPVAVTVNPYATTPTITASGPTSFCEGGSVTLTSSEASSYLWSTGATTRSITVDASGSYSVTVDPNGCSATSEPAVVTVNAPPATPAVTASGPTTFCEGGSVTLTAPDGFTYLWSNGATTQSITVSASGSYGVTVTDANGCSSSSAMTAVTVLPLPQAAIEASSTTLCAFSTVTLTASPAASYLWSNGATTQSITVNAAGTYSVTVSDGQCSKTSDPVTIVAETTTVTVTGSDNQLCPGDSVTVTSVVDGTAASYQWYGFGGQPVVGETGPTLNITPSTTGTSYYFLRITTPANCVIQSNTFIYTVTPADATVIASGQTSFCEGGTVDLSAQDLPGYSWLWSNGDTSRTITVATSGAYSVTVTNANGCTATSDPVVVTVDANPETPVIAASGPTTFCESGSVTLTAPAADNWLWSNGATSQAITVDGSGTYFVTVTNANGCSATSNPVVVTENAVPATPVIAASGATTFCAGGAVTLTAPAGLTYLWSNGATTQSITVDGSGTYSVTVTNASGCAATSSPVVVTENAIPAMPAITAGGPTTFCEGGSVTLTASAADSYLWSNGATSQSITVDGSGTYSVTVTNASGCAATSNAAVVTENAIPATPVIAASGPTTFCAGGSVTLTAPAGFTYLWSSGATSQSIAVSASGSYSVTVTNASGCSATSAPATVTVNSLPAATVTASGPTTFCQGGSVTLTAPAGLTYLWSNGATSQSIVAAASGSYSVTVTNANGCSATSAPAAVTVNPLPATPAITAGGPTTFCAGGSVTLTAPAGFTYLWSNGATTRSITVGASGSYSVTVTNANGCNATSAPSSVTVTPATAITQQPQSATIPRNTSRTLTVAASGTGTLTYQWYRGTSGNTSNPIGGATSASYNTGKLSRGTYTYWVRVTGTCGSVNSSTATITAQ
jgi:large repetitive protein